MELVLFVAPDNQFHVAPPFRPQAWRCRARFSSFSVVSVPSVVQKLFLIYHAERGAASNHDQNLRKRTRFERIVVRIPRAFCGSQAGHGRRLSSWRTGLRGGARIGTSGQCVGIIHRRAVGFGISISPCGFAIYRLLPQFAETGSSVWYVFCSISVIYA